MLIFLTLACRGPEPTLSTPTTAPQHTSEPIGTAHTGPTGSDSTDSASSQSDSADSADSGGNIYTGPLLLSETELYADLPGGVLAPGLILTTPQYPLWSDGAEKRRWLYVPAGEVIDTSNPDHWVFPVGTAAFKEFIRDGVRVETRRFAKQADGWSYVSFLWRDDGSDADAIPEGLDNARGTDHDVPDREDCAFCHVGPADLFLGVGAMQMSATEQAQLPLSAPVATDAPGEGNTKAALGYMHGNCSHCHREGTLPGDKSELYLDLLVSDTDPAAVHAVTSGVLKTAKHIIEGTTVVLIPGDPDQSQLWVRLGIVGLEGMPPRGTELTDTVSRDLIYEWITNLPE